jgi:hypothetical protein
MVQLNIEEDETMWWTANTVSIARTIKRTMTTYIRVDTNTQYTCTLYVVHHYHFSDLHAPELLEYQVASTAKDTRTPRSLHHCPSEC